MNRAAVLIAGAVVLLILAFASGLFVGKRSGSSEARMEWETALATADLDGELDPEKLPLLVDLAAVRFEVTEAEGCWPNATPASLSIDGRGIRSSAAVD